MCILNNISHRVSGAPNQLKPITKVRDIFVQCLHSCRDSPTVWPLCAFFFILLQFHVPFYVKKKKNDNFMCLLEFECAKRLKAHSRAIPELERQGFFLSYWGGAHDAWVWLNWAHPNQIMTNLQRRQSCNWNESCFSCHVYATPGQDELNLGICRGTIRLQVLKSRINRAIILIAFNWCFFYSWPLLIAQLCFNVKHFGEFLFYLQWN